MSEKPGAVGSVGSVKDQAHESLPAQFNGQHVPQHSEAAALNEPLSFTCCRIKWEWARFKRLALVLSIGFAILGVLKALLVYLPLSGALALQAVTASLAPVSILVFGILAYQDMGRLQEKGETSASWSNLGLSLLYILNGLQSIHFTLRDYPIFTFGDIEYRDSYTAIAALEIAHGVAPLIIQVLHTTRLARMRQKEYKTEDKTKSGEQAASSHTKNNVSKDPLDPWEPKSFRGVMAWFSLCTLLLLIAAGVVYWQASTKDNVLQLSEGLAVVELIWVLRYCTLRFGQF